MFVQLASALQLSVFVAHSSMSTNMVLLFYLVGTSFLNDEFVCRNTQEYSGYIFCKIVEVIINF